MPLSIVNVNPKLALPQGELVIHLSGSPEADLHLSSITANGFECFVRSISAGRAVIEVPATEEFELSIVQGPSCKLRLQGASGPADEFDIWCGRRIVGGMHIVANPAIDPSDGSMIVTRSGRRGEQLDTTLFRVDANGAVEALPENILNPTAVAFSPAGELYVTNRASGEVLVVGREGLSTVFSANLGIATGLAFDKRGTLYVGDRSGRIYRVWEYGDNEVFAEIEPSVAAFHIAFGPDDALYATAPGLSSFDSVYRIGPDGDVSKYFTGFGRPQGLAFDSAGNLYVAACRKGRRGIFRIDANSLDAELFVSGSDVVGLCFDRDGNMLVATSGSVYSFEVGIKGTLLN